MHSARVIGVFAAGGEEVGVHSILISKVDDLFSDLLQYTGYLQTILLN